jgi:hypothetical protein
MVKPYREDERIVAFSILDGPLWDLGDLLMLGGLRTALGDLFYFFFLFPQRNETMDLVVAKRQGTLASLPRVLFFF